MDRTPDNMTKLFNRQLVRPVGAVVPPKNHTKPVRTLVVKVDVEGQALGAKQQNLINVPLESVYKKVNG